MGEGGRSPILQVKQLICCALACKTYSSRSVTHFCGFAFRSHEFSLHVLTVRTYFTTISASELQTRKPDLPIPSDPFLMIIVGFVIHKNMSTSDPFAWDLVPILDSSKSLADYICQVALAACPSLVYYNNGTEAAQTRGGLSFLQLLSLPIVHTTIFWQVIPDESLM